MGKLYIIGTNHSDYVHGPKKLKNLYKSIKPDMVLTELCEKDLKKVRKLFSDLEDILKDVPDYKDDIESFADTFLPFEYKVNEEYSRIKGIPHHLIDMPDSKFNQRIIKILEEGFQRFKKGLQKYLDTYGPEDFKKNFDLKISKNAIQNPEKLKLSWENHLRYEKSAGKELSILFFAALGALGKRDKYMEKMVRELYDPNKNIACVVGMVHSLDSLTKKTLYSRIKDLKPERRPLI